MPANGWLPISSTLPVSIAKADEQLTILAGGTESSRQNREAHSPKQLPGAIMTYWFWRSRARKSILTAGPNTGLRIEQRFVHPNRDTVVIAVPAQNHSRSKPSSTERKR